MMRRLNRILDAIQPPDDHGRLVTQQRLDRLTKPPGSLGRLEELAVWHVRAKGKVKSPPLKKVVFTFAADHGVTEEGVSAYPKTVTTEMVSNFLRGGAAINVLARHVGAEVRVVDIGVDDSCEALPGLIHRKIARGTRNMARGPAMSRTQAETAIGTGIEMAEAAVREGVSLLGAGEMGIGNTTASSAITAVMTGAPIDDVTGKGTGIDDHALAVKRAVIHRAIRVNQPVASDPLDVLSKVGGFEIGGMAGLMLGAAAHRVPVVIDGFIAAAAALIAIGLKPDTHAYLLAAHRSAEPGHRMALEHLGLRPLLDLEMRLGEGTGAVLAMGLVEAALGILTEMATFEEAGVSQRETLA
jgi:nicotinate-nucleotide--dimethylbenzimidazole phosphoribosyltransferase